MSSKSVLEGVREAAGLSVRRVAELLTIDISGLIRIERGLSLPKRDTARALFEFYANEVPLGMVFDPLNPTYEHWLTQAKKKALRQLGRALVKRYPELAESDRRKRGMDDAA